MKWRSAVERVRDMAPRARRPSVVDRARPGPGRMVAVPQPRIADPKIRELDARFQAVANEWLLRTGHRIDNAYRTPVHQAQLYRRWKAGDRSIFLAARPGFSMHEYGLAFDIKGRPSAADVALARSLRMRWGGPKDPVHFDFGSVITLAQARREAGLA